MLDPIEDLLTRNDVTLAPPASRADIAALAERLSAPLPEGLMRIWAGSDGVQLDAIETRILAPAESLRLIDHERESGADTTDYIRVVHDLQSNYLAVYGRGILAPRVVHFPHDDGPRLLYRSFESCIRALIEAADRRDPARSLLFSTEGDYAPEAPRDAVEQAAGKALLAGRHVTDEWNHAARLLDASNLDEWAKLLETGHFVRREVRARLQKLGSPAIRELLRQDQQRFEEFVSVLTKGLKDAGLKVGERRGTCLNVSGGWSELESFFHRRHAPDAIARMVTWNQDLRARRDPRLRPGHLMSDEAAG